MGTGPGLPGAQRPTSIRARVRTSRVRASGENLVSTGTHTAPARMIAQKAITDAADRSTNTATGSPGDTPPRTSSRATRSACSTSSVLVMTMGPSMIAASAPH